MVNSDSEDKALFAGVNLPLTATTAAPPDIVLGTYVYKIALEIFSGRKFGCSSLGMMWTLLDTFVGQPATAFFKAGSQLGRRFNKFKTDMKSSFKSVSIRMMCGQAPPCSKTVSSSFSLTLAGE
jgi:hypothetical protein